MDRILANYSPRGLKELDMIEREKDNIRFPVTFCTELEPLILILCASIHDTEFPSQS